MTYKLLFEAQDTAGDTTFWITNADGTDAAETMFPSRAGLPAFTDAISLGDSALVVANDGVTAGLELFTINEDGTYASFADYDGTFAGSGPQNLYQVGSNYFFTAQTTGSGPGTNPQNFGRELYVTDGVTAPTQPIANIDNANTGSFALAPGNEIVDLNGTALFQAWDSDSEFELWQSDATSAQRVAGPDANTNGDLRLDNPFLTNDGVHNGTLYFKAIDQDPASTSFGDLELYTYDGAALTQHNTNTGGNDNPLDFVSFNGDLYFTAFNSAGDREIWKANGGNPIEVTDILTDFGSRNPSSLVSDGNMLYFTADNGLGIQNHLYAWDGSLSGPQEIMTGLNTISELTMVGNQLLLSVDAGGGQGQELYVYDGTTANPQIVSDTAVNGAASLGMNVTVGGLGAFSPQDLTVAGDLVYFSADDGSNGRELWVYDSNAADITDGSVTMVKSINFALGNANPLPFAVLDVNGAPTAPMIGTNPAAVAENAAPGTLIDTVTTTDPDGDARTDPDGDTLTFSLSDDAGGRFAINPSTGELSVAGALDFETAASHTITVDVSDGNGGTSQATFTIGVTDVNEAPSAVSMSGGSVAENSSSGVVVGTLSATDPEGGAISYRITQDAGMRFTLNGNQVILNGPVDFETDSTHAIEIVADDGTNQTTTPLNVTVTDVNEAPSGLALTANSVMENSAVGTVVGDLSATDPDMDALSFALSDTAGGLFGISGSEIVVDGALDYETATSHSVTATVTDPDGLTHSQTFSISITNDPSDDGPVLPQATPQNDVLNGTEMADVINALAGDDIVRGFGGNDQLNGGDGADTINGGDGDDQIMGGLSTADLRDVIYAGAGNDNVDGGYGNDLIYGMDGDDIIAGGFGSDELQGQGGNDVITGSALSDEVFGGAGNDFVNGGFGHDRINGGTGADKFYHLGIADHGSDWIQDFTHAEGDVLLFGNANANASDFQVNFNHTADLQGERSGDDNTMEAFVIYKPTEQIIWALVDGAGESSIMIDIGGTVTDLV